MTIKPVYPSINRDIAVTPSSAPVNAQEHTIVAPQQAAVAQVRPNLEEAQAEVTAQSLAREVADTSGSGLKVLGNLDHEKVARLLEED